VKKVVVKILQGTVG